MLKESKQIFMLAVSKKTSFLILHSESFTSLSGAVEHFSSLVFWNPGWSLRCARFLLFSSLYEMKVQVSAAPMPFTYFI